jgi:hypothetical protein
MKINQYLGALTLSCLAFHSALAQSVASLNGSYPVTESWSVTTHIGNGTTVTSTTYTGKETGTLVVNNGSYTQINHTGASLPSGLNTTMTIYYDGHNYNISGAYPFSAFGSGPAGYYAVIQLSFFVILVPLGTDSDIPNLYPSESSVFTTTGTSLTSLSGAGKMVDQAAAYGPITDLGFVNEIDASSTASLTLPPPDTTPPTINITSPMPGQLWSNAAFTVMGTAADNVAVAGVYCSLSNAVFNTGFVLATTANNWANWSALATPTPGTNTFAAYAVDTSGNVSTTKTVSFDYVVSAPLKVQLTGKGTITPNYSNAVLQVGATYSMTASALVGSGFAFTNWTGGTNLPLILVTNGMTVKFVMTSNLVLQANFVDTNKPTLSITNLVSGQRVSNSVFTVTGTATDNVAVASVYYSLSNSVGASPWTLASTANNWTNWNALVTLIPGTNMFAAYALDISGNVSTTSSISFQFVVTNQLQIRTIGLGTISPNYSNAWLNIGQNYSITSSPASGFIFTNWTVSTNWISGAVMTGTNLQFVMQSNLTLQANFVETNKPTLTITAPTAGQHMTNALATVAGTTSDNWGVTGVWYQLNSGAWNASVTTNGWTNWTTTVELIAGTNTVKAYAMNLGGNVSTNSSVSIVSSNTFMLQLVFTNSVPLKTNGLAFSLQLSTGLNGHIQVSTNLTSWDTLTNFVGTNSTLIFRDPAATNFSRRFYRAVIP